MNPFDLPGTTFLGVWLLGCCVVALVVIVMRAIVARSNARARPADIADTLHPTEIAFLVGGITRALEAAVAGLHHRGFVELDPETKRLHVTGKQGDTVLRPNGVFRGVIVGEEQSRVEAYVLERLPADMHDLVAGSDSLEIVLQRRLEELGLLVENPRRGTQLVRAPAYVWMLVGGIKLAIGLSRGKPVFGLVLLLVGAAFVLFKIHAPRMTSVGRELVAELEHRYAALETTARTAPQQLDATDMTLAYGVYGYLVAPALLMTMMPSYQTAALAATTSVTSSSCGTSCSGGSSCGSSCGGGCGGGCGGCS